MRSPLRLILPLALVGLCAAAAPAHAQSPDLRFANPTRFATQTGETIYADVCQGCHMPDGQGATGAGTYPALAKNPKLSAAAYPVFMVIKGRKGMPPFGSQLTDQQVAAVVNYVRTHFGNDYRDEVMPSDAAAGRK
jgi:mono/diheme cytochrome c family protein